MKNFKVLILLSLFCIFLFNKVSFSQNKTLSNNELHKSCMSYLNKNENKDLCVGYISGVYETMVMQRATSQVQKLKNFGFRHCGKMPLSKETIYFVAYKLDQAIQKKNGEMSAIGTVVVSLLNYNCKSIK